MFNSDKFVTAVVAVAKIRQYVLFGVVIENYRARFLKQHLIHLLLYRGAALVFYTLGDVGDRGIHQRFAVLFENAVADVHPETRSVAA